jgi:hypothetical protein
MEPVPSSRLAVIETWARDRAEHQQCGKSGADSHPVRSRPFFNRSGCYFFSLFNSVSRKLQQTRKIWMEPGGGIFELFRVMQLLPQGFHDQTDERMRNGIRGENLVKANCVVPTSYRNRAGQADESPDIPYSFIRGWKRCESKKAPRNQQSQSLHPPTSQFGISWCHS